LGVYFTTYAYLLDYFNRKKKGPVSLTSALLAGGIAGVSAWALAYPIDYIKTIVQTDDLEQPKQKTMRGYFRQ
jgi:solute carrier family 25 carnitine/acylcarnitine transporter 20/29